ncbi:hypothetical protein HRED_10597 [Candidatus Haloredivivus sp. G17]|nr:hypothetical protein HRED_10597 [Candidatus Haloredivivus sp. G17]
MDFSGLSFSKETQQKLIALISMSLASPGPLFTTFIKNEVTSFSSSLSSLI